MATEANRVAIEFALFERHRIENNVAIHKKENTDFCLCNYLGFFFKKNHYTLEKINGSVALAELLLKEINATEPKITSVLG